MRPPDHDAHDDAHDDAALIERSRHDPEAFAGLYDRHAAALHRYDLTVSDARPWLYGIAANLIGKHSRSEVRMLRAYARTGADPVLSEANIDEADGRLASAAVRQDLAAALAALTSGDRDVLLMIAWADLSYTEVATALGIPVGTVRSRLHRARARIRAALGGHDPTSAREESLP